MLGKSASFIFPMHMISGDQKGIGAEPSRNYFASITEHGSGRKNKGEQAFIGGGVTSIVGVIPM